MTSDQWPMTLSNISMPVSDFLQSWLGLGLPVDLLLYAVAGPLLLGLLLGLWFLLGPGPRRNRAYKRFLLLLQQGQWQPALSLVQEMQDQARNSPAWLSKWQHAEGLCFRAAAEEALRDKQYEASLGHFLKAAPRLRLNEAEVRGQIVEAMLAEVRQLFAANSSADPNIIHQLLARIVTICAVSPEASFWQGLCHLRSGNTDLALASLTRAYQESAGGVPSQQRGAAKGGIAFIDPPLYLGTLLSRMGRADEAVRYLAEASRLDANCPFVTWQLGTAMLAAGGDTLIAVRALQRALGPKGLLQWARTPERVWVEAFPEKLSLVRRLASKHPYRCPLFGDDVSLMIRQGQVALGQGQYRLGNFEASADLFNQVLQEGAPSLPVVRGLGLALARLDRFDEAFKHLRTAFEIEDPKNFLTAGYLALCGAKGKPTKAEDKYKNVNWAIRLVANFQVPGNAEWALILNRIFAEARSINLLVPVEDQVRLCNILVSVDATEPLSAGAFAHLAASLRENEDQGSQIEGGELTSPDEPPVIVGSQSSILDPRSSVFRPEYAWLYTRTAQQHGFTSEQDLDLFALTFTTAGEARNFFAQRQWDFDEVEFTYLERCAARQPGTFPQALGEDYPARGENLLLARSERLEGMKDKEGAAACVEILLKLAPRCTRAQDRLAYLRYRAGDLNRAAELLESWSQLEPTNYWPFVRRAVIEQQRGHSGRRATAIGKALGLTTGKVRAEIAFLGARLALQDGFLTAPSGVREEQAKPGNQENGQVDRSQPLLASSLTPDTLPLTPDWEGATHLLNECLKADPEHEAGLWCMAAVRCVRQQVDGLAAQAAAMHRLEEKTEPHAARFYFLAAVCHLAGGEYGRALESARKAADKDPNLALECSYLVGWASWLRGDLTSAGRALQKTALAESPSTAYARALLGKVCFNQECYEDAISWWKSLDASRRKEWDFENALSGTAFVTALQAFQEGQFEKAAEKFREAGRFGWRDRRLGPLLTLALVKAGQQLLYL
jgi:tetratricopeptide (TPR) repeat protein